MASYDEQLFWQEHLPRFSLKGGLTAPAKGVGAKELSSCTPISLSSSPPSPLVTLPVELLCKIFALTIRAREEPDTFSYVKATSPTKLVQICRYWRIVALSDPTLWSSIAACRVNQSTLHRVHLWLVRAGPTCPLSLFLGFSRDTDSTQVLRGIMSLFIANRNRWNDIYFQISHVQALQMLAELPSGAARQLNAMHLYLGPGLPFEVEHQAWTALGSSPNLRVLTLEGGEEDQLAFIPPLPWRQLTTITFYGVDCQAMASILGFCQELEHLYILAPTIDDLPMNLAPILLPSLRKLCIRTSVNSAPVLSFLTAPRLRELIISHGRHNTTSYPVHLNQLLTRSQCPLRYFEFHDFQLSGKKLIECIQSPILSGVKIAALSGKLSDSVIEALTLKTVDGRYSGLLPSLSSISLRRCMVSDPRLLENMIHSRVTEEGWLKSAQLRVDKDPVSSRFIVDMKKATGVVIACSIE
ncbi:hypothetical protein AX16_008607 [Volvariella volvacea WC 439]|nr:hypothetical protein AX16_008607 [Volvariella volvacea WC 439]